MLDQDRLRKVLARLPATRFSQGIFFLLLILSCQQLATLTWQLLPGKELPRRIDWTPPKASSAAATNPLDVRSLLAVALFGRPVAPEAQAAAVAKTSAQGHVEQNAPRTRLNLTLTGILASTNDPARSIAIVVNASDESGYGIGDLITGTQAKVRAILPDRIILSNQGQDETLMLDGEEYKEVGGATPASASPAAADTNLRQLRDDLVKNPGKLLDYINISPIMRDGKLGGYRINPGKDVAFFHRIGLQSNDLAIAINGFDLRDNAQAMQIMGQLSSLTEMNLTVERNGQQQDVYIKLTE